MTASIKSKPRSNRSGPKRSDTSKNQDHFVNQPNIDQPKPAAIIRLHFSAGSLAPQTRELLPGSFILGRKPDADIIFDTTADSLVSGHHARLFYDNDQWYIDDLNSTNGTQLHDQPITQPTPLEHNHRITLGIANQIGAVTFKVETEIDSVSSTTPAPTPTPNDKTDEGSSTFVFPCSHCGRSNQGNFAMIGQKRPCITCGKLTEVTLPSIQSPKPTHEDPFAQPNPAQQYTPEQPHPQIDPVAAGAPAQPAPKQGWNPFKKIKAAYHRHAERKALKQHLAELEANRPTTQYTADYACEHLARELWENDQSTLSEFPEAQTIIQNADQATQLASQLDDLTQQLNTLSAEHETALANWQCNHDKLTEELNATTQPLADASAAFTEANRPLIEHLTPTLNDIQSLADDAARFNPSSDNPLPDDIHAALNEFALKLKDIQTVRKSPGDEYKELHKTQSAALAKKQSAQAAHDSAQSNLNESNTKKQTLETEFTRSYNTLTEQKSELESQNNELQQQMTPAYIALGRTLIAANTPAAQASQHYPHAVSAINSLQQLDTEIAQLHQQLNA